MEGAMSYAQPLIDAAGRRRSPPSMPGFRMGKAPRNKGQRYAADPPTIEEIIAVMGELNKLATVTASTADRRALARRAAVSTRRCR